MLHSTTTVSVLLALALGVGTAACASRAGEAGDATLQQAANVTMQLDLPAARALLTSVLEDEDSPVEDRALGAQFI